MKRQKNTLHLLDQNLQTVMARLSTHFGSQSAWLDK